MKGVALQTSPATYRYPGIMGLCPGPPEKGGLELALCYKGVEDVKGLSEVGKSLIQASID